MKKPALMILLCGFALLAACAEKPVLEHLEAQAALATARDLEADIYAPLEYEAAVIALESAERAIAEQEAAPAWSRSYNLSIQMLEQARAEAEIAQGSAAMQKEEIFRRAESGLPAARVRIQTAYEALERARSRLTAREFETLRSELLAANATLDEAGELLEGGGYAEVLTRLEQADATAARIELRARQVADFGDPRF